MRLPLSSVDFLIHLIRNRERAVGRDELAASVWGRCDVSEVSVNHAVARLRRVLGDSAAEQNAIRTLPRLGYRWVLEPVVEEFTPGSEAEACADDEHDRAGKAVLSEAASDAPEHAP